ncbi:WD40-repeat-containing domain protein [Mycotypha africana]|uniref:WD40-repeat-containing domain protein n=1 Tax=Mycotypha africana TaxID=64632 RepID=UPI0022FFD2DD|nr:WD40-repeat-containing domain protein [Mycotypha africana]KAI8982245.1 WD40-repeat-containing domain protein [Mycotypha africana]
MIKTQRKPFIIKAARCTLGLLNTSATCLSWGGHKKLAVGHGNGHLSIWNVERALRRPNGNDITKSKLFLMLSLCCMDSCIRSLNWNGYHDPTKIFMGGYDGQVLVFDTLDPFFTKTMFRSRGLVCGTAWSHHSHILFHIDSDGHCRGEGFAKDNTQVGFKYGLVQGFVWEMCVSPHHGHFAVVSALGWVRSNNMFMNKKKKLSVVQKSVYKLHYDEETDELRYIDGIGYHNLDELRASPAYNQYGKSLMSIHKAAWNPNRSTSAFLATGGAAGLCRIDFEGKGSKWN